MTEELFPEANSITRLSQIGSGKAVVFSPDLSVRTNRQFYERLGFFYIEDASWPSVMRQIAARNEQYPASPVQTLIIESHGTNGNGLKLQIGDKRSDARSYISVGGLQEKLESVGVSLAVITACNAGRLFRPQIYKTLNPHCGDPLFLPATLGIVNASPAFDPANAHVVVAYPMKSDLETANEADIAEFSPKTAELLGFPRAGGDVVTHHTDPTGSPHFVVSDILVQLILHDRQLEMKTNGYVLQKSRENFTNAESEQIVQRFFDFIEEVAKREYEIAHGRR